MTDNVETERQIDALAAAFPHRDYTTMIDPETGVELNEPQTMRCSDCGRLAFYDDSRDDYRHAEDVERGCFLIPPEDETTLHVRLPHVFYFDHVNRDLPGGAIIVETQSALVVSLTDDELAELRSDAHYYETAGVAVFGRESLGLISSARATVRAIDAAVAASVKR